jgi:hypothetical protein
MVSEERELTEMEWEDYLMFKGGERDRPSPGRLCVCYCDIYSYLPYSTTSLCAYSVWPMIYIYNVYDEISPYSIRGMCYVLVR